MVPAFSRLLLLPLLAVVFFCLPGFCELLLPERTNGGTNGGTGSLLSSSSAASGRIAKRSNKAR